MASQLMILQDRKAKLIKQLAAVSAEMTGLADKAGDATQEELQASREKLDVQYNETKAQLATVDADLARAEEVQAFERSLSSVVPDSNRLTSEAQRDVSGVRNLGLASRDDPKGGFTDHREMLTCVMQAGIPGGRVDPRLARFAAPARDPMATAGSDEQSTFADPYGGFLIPTAFLPRLMKIDPEVDPIADKTTKIPMEYAQVSFPARTDKDHSTSVSGGLTVTRRAEGDAGTSSRMVMEKVTLNAHALFGLAYATEEVLERSPISFIALLENGFRDEFGSHLVDERLNGSGVGEFEGIATSPCKIAVPKEDGQDAATITYGNIVDMRSRCWRYGQAIWLANHDTLPELAKMVHVVGTGGVPVWQTSAREDVPDILFGRPLYFTEYTKTLGTEGDIWLTNWSQYLEGELSPLRSADSVHVRFLNHERTFKFWVENDGRCWWRSALTPKNSTTTLSPFVSLAVRA